MIISINTWRHQNVNIHMFGSIYQKCIKRPEDLKMFSFASKSEILGLENRNKISPNLPPGKLSIEKLL